MKLSESLELLTSLGLDPDIDRFVVSQKFAHKIAKKINEDSAGLSFFMVHPGVQFQLLGVPMEVSNEAA